MPFLAESARVLRDVLFPRLQRAMETLPRTDVWWRPHEGCTSAGNLVRHLEGNVRQWILRGLGGRTGTRDRAAEFAAREGDPGVERLAETVREAAEVIEALDDARLETPLTIQGIETTPLQAVVHVVEHFAWHTGQIVWIAKMRAGERHGLAFYDDVRLNERH